jgi:hydroxyethylthiazole kinase-like uncharacterized protein yjeF
MRDPVTVEQMKVLEERGEILGVTKLMMMENAGSSIADYLNETLMTSNKATQKIVAIAGTGNNGGDVFVAARHLVYWPQYAVSVILIGNESRIRVEEAKVNWNIVSQIPKIKKVVVDRKEKLNLLEKEISNARAMCVGIFGTGFRGKPRDLQLQAIKLINEPKGVLKISVDIPSGMEADSGAFEYCVESDVTVTMYAPKKGMLEPRAQSKTGKIVEANIGLPF